MDKKKQKKYALKKRTKFSHNLLPVIESLAAEGRSLADIGMMLGYAGKSPKTWMSYLKKTYPEVKDAVEAGRMMADVQLVATAWDVVNGYDAEETTIDYKALPEPEEKGKPRKYKYIEMGRKKKVVPVKPDSTLLFRMLCNRLPEYFSDTKTIDVNKRSINVEATVTAEIEDFAGKLIDMAHKRKKIASEEIKK